MVHRAEDGTLLEAKDPIVLSEDGEPVHIPNEKFARKDTIYYERIYKSKSWIVPILLFSALILFLIIGTFFSSILFLILVGAALVRLLFQFLLGSRR